MIIVLLIGFALAGVSVLFFVRSVAFGRLRRQETLAQIGAYGFVADAQTQSERRGPREISRLLVEALGRLSLRFVRVDRERELRGLLRSAGFYRIQAETFLGCRILAAFVPGLLWLLLVLASGSFGLRALLAIGVVGGLGWVMPTFVLKRRAAHRLQEIDAEMPELVDLLVTTVESGTAFAASLQLIALRVEGPLGDELRLALQEQNMGLTIEDALQHMLMRADTPALRAFVQAVVQGQTLGVSVGKILRDLAVEMRKRRRQSAEERAQKAPTKILFPLIALILPALFIVALGGPVIGLVHSLAAA